MQPQDALKHLINEFRYNKDDSGVDYVQYLKGTPYDKYGAILCLHSAIGHLSENTINIGGNFAKLFQNDENFLRAYAEEARELIEAAQCVYSWNESTHQEQEDIYLKNQTFNMSLAVQLPIVSYDIYFGSDEGKPEYNVESVFQNALDNSWDHILLMLIARINRYYGFVDINSIPKAFHVPEEKAQSLEIIAKGISSNLASAVKMFFDRTIRPKSNIYKIDRLCLEFTLLHHHHHHLNPKTIPIELLPFFDAHKGQSKLICRQKYYDTGYTDKIFPMVLASVASLKSQRALKINHSMDLGFTYAQQRPDFKKLVKLFNGRSKSSINERTIVLSYLLGLGESKLELTWHTGFAHSADTLYIFSEYSGDELVKILRNHKQIDKVSFLSADYERIFVLEDPTNAKGVLIYEFKLTTNARSSLLATYKALKGSRDLPNMGLKLLREINDSRTLTMDIFEDGHTLSELLGYRA